MKLAYFNRLPTRPEYVDKVLACLDDSDGMPDAAIARATGLTKTQVLCTLEKLLEDDRIFVRHKPRRFVLKQ